MSVAPGDHGESMLLPALEAALAAMPSVQLHQLLLVWLAILFAALLRAFTGFGFALGAVPVFTLFMAPAQAVVLGASLGLSISLTSLRSYWGQVPLRPMLPMLSMAMAGSLAGALLLAGLSVESFQLWIGLAVIAACLLLTFYRPTVVKPRPWLAAAAGLCSGLLNGAFAIPGPPVVVYAMATEPHPLRARSMLMTFFLFAAVAALLSYVVAGLVTWLSLWLFLLGFPAMYVGDKLGTFLFHRYGTTAHRRVALLTLYGIGVGITVRALGAIG